MFLNGRDNLGGFCDIIIGGSVAEWLKAHDSKSCGRASVSKVRILSLPPNLKSLGGYFLWVLFGNFLLSVIMGARWRKKKGSKSTKEQKGK